MTEQDQRLTIEREPTPSAEAQSFETPDERRDARAKGHELDLLRLKQGRVGRLIGCSDASLTISFIALAVLCTLLAGALVGSYVAPAIFGEHVGKLLTAVLTVMGYVMGKSQGKSD